MDSNDDMSAANRMSDERSTIAGVFTDHAQADQAIADLRAAGFTDDQIGYATRGEDGTNTAARDVLGGSGDTDSGSATSDSDTRGGRREGLVMGAVTGASLGSIIGAAMALFVPGVGPVLAGGILGAALTGAAVGATAGGIAGTLREWGFSEHEAAYYEGELQAGRIIVTVHAGARAQEARAVLARYGAYDSGTQVTP